MALGRRGGVEPGASSKPTALSRTTTTTIAALHGGFCIKLGRPTVSLSLTGSGCAARGVDRIGCAGGDVMTTALRDHRTIVARERGNRVSGNLNCQVVGLCGARFRRNRHDQATFSSGGTSFALGSMV
jgi:hypothetical protein